MSYEHRADHKRETRDRLRAAFINSGLNWDADAFELAYEKSMEDLPLAVFILVDTEQIPYVFAQLPLTGELGLDGRIRPTWASHQASHPQHFFSLTHLVTACNTWSQS